MNRRRFIKTGLIFVPTIFSAGVHGAVRLGTLEPEVNSWMGRVVTNAGHYSSLSIVAQDTAMKMVKSSGHLPKVPRWSLYCGSDQLACMTPLVNTLGSSVDTQAGTAGGWTYTEATGLTGNGTNNYVSTGFIPATHWSSVNDCCMGVYVRTKQTTTDAVMGCSQGTDTFYLLPCYGGTTSYAAMCNVTNQVSFADSAGLGHYLCSRPASNSHVFYKNGISQASTTTPGGSLVASWNILLHAFAAAGIPAAWSARTLGGYEICNGLTAAQVVGHYNAVQRAQTILG